MSVVFTALQTSQSIAIDSVLQCGDLEEEHVTVKQVVVLKGTAGQGL